MTLVLSNEYEFSNCSRDNEGHREFWVTHQVKMDSTNYGPKSALDCPGIPAVGSRWNFGGDYDYWCFCHPDARISFEPSKGERPVKALVSQKFSTRPIKRCQDNDIEDPLLEPQKVGGSFVKYTKEAKYDRYGEAIRTSSHEIIHGPQVEIDANRPQVWIEQNVGTLELATFSQMVDTVNSTAMWGLSARCVKLSNVTWERKIWHTCSYYYTRRFEFDIDYNTFDRNIVDEGWKALNGQWADDGTWDLIDINGTAPDPNNPSHFIRIKDRAGENMKCLLDGTGKPLAVDFSTGTGTAGAATDVENIPNSPIQFYDQSNFFLLGIPASF